MKTPPSSFPDWYRDIQEACEDPTWPPLPTLGGGTAPLRPTPDQALPLRPRDVAQANRENPASSAPPLSPAADLSRSMRFDCPACLGTLEVPVAFAGQPGPCPHCQTLIAPPRLVDPAELGLVAPQPSPAQETREGRFRPDRSLAMIAWVKGEVRSTSPGENPSPPRQPR